MAENSKIEWTTHSFSPWIGCTEISPGCDNCYARVLAARYGWAEWGTGKPRRRTSASTWRNPIKWNAAAAKSGARVFPSLCDPFDNEVPDGWLCDFLELIDNTPHLSWLLLTKRIGNAAKCGAIHYRSGWPKNVWLGISVVNQEEADRDIPKLLAVLARVRFISYEPALEAVTLDRWLWRLDEAGFAAPRRELHWVIVGGESGGNARPFQLVWAHRIVEQCRSASVACFVKQLGADPRIDAAQFPTERRMGGWDRKGGDMDLWPADLRVREFPRESRDAR